MGKLKSQWLDTIENAEHLESYNDDPNPDTQDTVKREIPDWYLRIINQTIDEELPF
jgi:hypothetical protein